MVKWKLFGFGVYYYLIKILDDDIFVCLLCIFVGKFVLEYIYGGWELMLVFKGSFSDISGRFGLGDFEEIDELVDY